MKFDARLPDDSVNVSRTHPLREAATLLVGITVVAAGLFVIVALAVEWLVPWIPPEFEARIFSGSLPEIAEEGDPESARDPRETEVADLLGRISAHWRGNPYTLKSAILVEETPNALAFPGGYVVVTTGLLDSVGSENELAFVLAHEVGHFRNRDHLAGMGRGVTFGLLLATLGIGGSGAAAGIAGVAGGIAATSFSRDQERDADEFALGLVNAEYGHVGGAAMFFERLPEPGGPVPDEVASYLSTHPRNDDRVEDARRIAIENGWTLGGVLMPFSADQPSGPQPQ